MRTTKRHVGIKILADVSQESKSTSYDYTSQTMTNKTYFRVWIKLDILKISS